ncbi:MAG: PIG-L family deacetylase [Bacteroidetes bacterium]|nr:PIG-L family deacetylase [Bacteroidota bacterium]MBL6942898.1 PIG-L family deacetylase [Bacteroidales bacterium]
MSTIKLTTLTVLILTITACSYKPTVEELKKFTATEIYPDDIYLDTVANKKALIIVAHDDDDCMMSGTIAKLTAAGWTIKQLSLQVHKIPGEDRNPAHIICEGSEKILEDGLYRPSEDTIKYPWMPISHEEIEKQYLYEKVATALIARVNEFNPSIIFTLDNIKGGYGHPDHIFLSQLVLDLFKEGKINAQFIYQSVLTKHMEAEIDKYMIPKMEKWGYPQASPAANELYGIDGMPEADVQIYITDQAEIKMAYLRAYPENVRKNLRKFLIYYEDFDAETFFSVWDREFFRIIEK